MQISRSSHNNKNKSRTTKSQEKESKDFERSGGPTSANMEEGSNNDDGAGETPTEPEEMKADDDETEIESNGEGPASPANNNDEDDDGDNDENENENGAKAAKSGSAAAKKRDRSKAAEVAKRGTSKPYIELVHEAIVELKDRTGSSQPAVMKYLLAKYPNLQTSAPNNRFKTHVLAALKSGVKSKRFIKVRASWKINAEWKKKQVAAQKRKRLQEAKKKKESREKKKEEELENQKDPLQKKIDSLRAKNPDSGELKKLLAEVKRKEEAEARRKVIAERIRRRRFPMEDTKLHAEDKELGVKPPKEVLPRPNLPIFFSLTQKDVQRPNTKYTATASRCEGLEKGNRGLVSDLLQVYHFFRGDVHYVGSADHPIIPEFSLKHLIYAVDDVLSQTAKRSRMVPPLIVHLFVTCLQLLTEPPEAQSEDSPHRRQLQQDFATHLRAMLSPTSWADVCFLYMHAIDLHFKSETSEDKNLLKGLPIDAEYLLGLHDEEIAMDPTDELEGYQGFLGPPEGVLAKAHEKLGRQDPWLQTAEELMALLRALTDEVLARKPEIGEDISGREEKMYELLKAKRAADAKLRKVRLAFEGPKQPPKKPSANNEESNNNMDDDDKRKSVDSSGGNDDNGQGKTEFKPTATKKQFEAAKKAQQKANDAYEKGVRNLMARTEPIGKDRLHNAVYCFRHDPEVLYVEVAKPMGATGALSPNWQNQKFTWHVIDKKSLFDEYEGSLDKRGRREKALQEELTGAPGTQQSLRRFLFDDVKEKAAASAQKKEKEDLLRKMENAKHKCAEEEGRRSGRLASRAEEEKEQIQEEIDELNEKIKNGASVKDLDYFELTGLDLLQKFDSAGKIETRRSREKKKKAVTDNKLQSMHCSKLCSTGNIDGTGFLGMVVSKMLEVEEMCESLVPWDKKNVERKTWVMELENLVAAWNVASPVLIGPSDDSSQQTASPRPSMDMSTPPSGLSATSKGTKKRTSTGGSTASKRMKTEGDSPQSSSMTVSQAVAKLKTPLLDLEKRVYQITGLSMAARDMAIADENMSVQEEGGEDNERERKKKLAWRKLIHKLRNVPSKRHAVVKQILVDALAAARKANLKEVVGELKDALLEYHSTAAGACKTAALKVLDSHGGYDDSEDDDDEEDEDEEDQENEGDKKKNEVSSSLHLDAIIVNGSLDSNSEDVNHDDWVEYVKTCKTLSRMGSLVTSFATRAKSKLGKIQEERETLMEAVAGWEKEEERRARAKNNGKAPTTTNNSGFNKLKSSEVWANVEFTEEMVMASVDYYPWWPAKKCVPKDASLEASLQSAERCLVSLIGESGGLRVLSLDHVRPFTGELVPDDDTVIKDLGKVTKEVKTQLDECMAIARRLQRSLNGKKAGRKPPATIAVKTETEVKTENGTNSVKAETGVERAESDVMAESDVKAESDAKAEEASTGTS
ncbi:expressed unknown protein [Seminavis robusta]|uniref:H15 domain-containing protein n=1 Tax=Seminavis robusta TaxID=568900 RepID=A0A9N8H5B9_9STRA|nr:expressed unknown protein [Seminavis robusta]|eukprot:Sro110_g054750.1 n/a (1429) ;mRNA; f:10520-15296